MGAKITDVPNSALKKVLYPDHEKEFTESVDFKKQYCDITIICGDNVRIKTHKTLLAVSSVFLKDCLLASESSRDQMCFISLPNVNSYDVQMLLKVLTEGFAVASAKNLERLREVMTFLGINLPKKKNSASTSGAELGKSSPNKFLPCQSSTSTNPLHSLTPVKQENGCFDGPTLACSDKIHNQNGTPEVEKLFLPSTSTTVNIKQEVIEENENEPENMTQSMDYMENESQQSLVKDPLGGVSFEEENFDADRQTSESPTNSLQEQEEEEDVTRERPLRAVGKKRNRHFDMRQRALFEKYYQEAPFPPKEVYDALEEKLGLPRKLITDWFSYRRNRFKGYRRNMGNRKVPGRPKSVLIMSNEEVQPVHKVASPIKPKVKALEQCEDIEMSVSTQRDSKPKQSIKHSGGKPPRRAFTKEERAYLEKIFKIIPFPAGDLYQKLERKLWVSKKALYDWFSHRRSKYKTVVKKIDMKKPTVPEDPEQECSSQSKSTDVSDKFTVPSTTLSEEESSQEEEIQQDAGHIRGGGEEEGEVLEQDSSLYLSPNKHRLKVDIDKKPAIYDRTVFLRHEKVRMEEIYSKTKFPGSDIITELEQEFKVSRKALTDWFGHRRRRDKSLMEKKKENEMASKIRSKYKKSMLSNKEKECLEKFYNEEKFPTAYERRQIGRDIGISECVVSRWFIQRRSNDIAGIFKVNKQTGSARRRLRSISTPSSSQQSESVNEDIEDQQSEGGEGEHDNVLNES